jgi:hypothetical protein
MNTPELQLQLGRPYAARVLPLQPGEPTQPRSTQGASAAAASGQLAPWGTSK